MKRAKRKKHTDAPQRCRYCGAPIVRRSADGIYRENRNHVELYVCSRYPECDAYVRIDPITGRAIGTLANPKLRMLRNEAHKAFDQLFHSKCMTRDDAYAWLSHLLCVPRSQAHIGYLDEYGCKRVIEQSRLELQAWRERKSRIGGMTA